MSSPGSRLPPEAERAARQLERTTRVILDAVVKIQKSPRWQELQTALSALGRLTGADTEELEKLPAINAAEAADAVGFLARTFLFDPAMLESGGDKGPVFRLKVSRPPKSKGEDARLTKLINALNLATFVRERADKVTEIVCSAGGVDKPFITLAVGAARLDLVMDLSAARGAWAHVATVLQQVAGDAEVELEGLELREIAGVLSVGVSVPAAERLVVSVDLEKDLTVEGALGAGPLHARIRASRPLLQLENDSTSGSGKLSLNLGAVTLRVPTAEEGKPRGTIELRVPGLAADLVAKPGDNPIIVSNLSLGSEAAVVTRDGAKIGFAELNAAGNRKTTLALRPQGAAAMDIELPAPLTVGIGWDGETWAVKTTQGARLRLSTDSEEDTDDLLQVIQGELSVGVTGGRPVKAGAGKFLVVLDEDEGRKDEKHPLLRLLTVR